MEQLVRKKKFKTILGVQEKSVDNWFARGLPHCTPSVNLCFIDVNLAIKWFEQQNNPRTRERAERLKKYILVLEKPEG